MTFRNRPCFVTAAQCIRTFSALLSRTCSRAVAVAPLLPLAIGMQAKQAIGRVGGPHDELVNRLSLGVSDCSTDVWDCEDTHMDDLTWRALADHSGIEGLVRKLEVAPITRYQIPAFGRRPEELLRIGLPLESDLIG